MIKINKSDVPDVLKVNKDIWTDALMKAVKNHGGYDKIPKDEKERLLENYRHKEIKTPLFESSFHKCAFCECKPEFGGGNIEVEHFAPKSIYTELTFEWKNLLPVCRKCNGAKGDFDTVLEPIINPADIDPETIFAYEYLWIVPIKGTQKENTAGKTLEVCNLNSPRLYDARSKLLIQLTEYIDELKENILLINNADTDQKKRVRITKLINSLEKFEQTMEASSCYAGYCRWYANNNSTYSEAKSYASS